MENDRLPLPIDALNQLIQLKAKPKFGPSEPTERQPLGYVGYLPPEEQPNAEAALNTLIDRVISVIDVNPSKALVLKEFAATFPFFEDSDTEDRECLCWYLEDIMDAVGMESSDGLLNDFMYG